MPRQGPRERTSGGAALPSDAELRILRQLWMHGPQSVREIHERVESEWSVGYTTVLKLLQRMLDKGLVERMPEGRLHRYRALVRRESTERRLVRDLADRLFGGSMRELVQAALPPESPDDRDLEELQRLIRKMEEAES